VRLVPATVHGSVSTSAQPGGTGLEGRSRGSVVEDDKLVAMPGVSLPAQPSRSRHGIAGHGSAAEIAGTLQ
jgi:hypothetical protein